MKSKSNFVDNKIKEYTYETENINEGSWSESIANLSNFDWLFCLQYCGRFRFKMTKSLMKTNNGIVRMQLKKMLQATMDGWGPIRNINFTDFADKLAILTQINP
jgi:hypothetical protein